MAAGGQRRPSSACGAQRRVDKPGGQPVPAGTGKGCPPSSRRRRALTQGGAARRGADEERGDVGIITLEDIIEEILCEDADEADREKALKTVRRHVVEKILPALEFRRRSQRASPRGGLRLKPEEAPPLRAVARAIRRAGAFSERRRAATSKDLDTAASGGCRRRCSSGPRCERGVYRIQLCPLVGEEDPRAVVRVEQLELGLVRLDPPARERVGVVLPSSRRRRRRPCRLELALVLGELRLDASNQWSDSKREFWSSSFSKYARPIASRRR